MEKEDIFPPTGPYHSQQFCCSCLLWFKIFTPTIQTDFGEKPSTRGEKGSSTSDCKTRTSSPIHRPTIRLDTWHSKHLPLGAKGIWCHVCSTKNKKSRTKFRCA